MSAAFNAAAMATIASANQVIMSAGQVASEEPVTDSVEAPPTQPEVTPQEKWLLGSIPQLDRFWSGRCVTCTHWTANGRGNHGACSAMGASKTDPLVDVGRIDPTTQATFGCVLWTIVAPTEKNDENGERVFDPETGQPVLEGVEEAAASNRARTELALKLGLLDPMPEGFS